MPIEMTNTSKDLPVFTSKARNNQSQFEEHKREKIL